MLGELVIFFSLVYLQGHYWDKTEITIYSFGFWSALSCQDRAQGGVQGNYGKLKQIKTIQVIILKDGIKNFS